MRNYVAALCLLGLVAVSSDSQAPEPPPVKVGILQAMDAILSTQEGKKAFEGLDKEFQPKRAAIEKKNAEIQSWKDQLAKGSATFADEARQNLQSRIDAATRQVGRDAEDAQAEWEEAQGKLTQQFGGKMVEILGRHATANGYALILDVSNQQTQVLWAAPGVNLTAE